MYIFKYHDNYICLIVYVSRYIRSNESFVSETNHFIGAENSLSAIVFYLPVTALKQLFLFSLSTTFGRIVFIYVFILVELFITIIYKMINFSNRTKLNIFFIIYETKTNKKKKDY